MASINNPLGVYQALDAADDAAVDACLTAPVGSKTIWETAAALLPASAEAALAAAFARLRKRPGRGQQLVAWARAILLSHAHHLQASKGGCLPPDHFSELAVKVRHAAAEQDGAPQQPVTRVISLPARAHCLSAPKAGASVP